MGPYCLCTHLSPSYRKNFIEVSEKMKEQMNFDWLKLMFWDTALQTFSNMKNIVIIACMVILLLFSYQIIFWSVCNYFIYVFNENFCAGRTKNNAQVMWLESTWRVALLFNLVGHWRTLALSSKPPTPLPKAYSVTRYLNEDENIPVFIPRIGNPSAFRERRRYPSCAPRHFKRLF